MVSGPLLGVRRALGGRTQEALPLTANCWPVRPRGRMFAAIHRSYFVYATTVDELDLVKTAPPAGYAADPTEYASGDTHASHELLSTTTAAAKLVAWVARRERIVVDGWRLFAGACGDVGRSTGLSGR